MNEKYTQQDVQRLVKEAEDVLRNIQNGDRMSRDGGYQHTLNEALVPFRPDPEEELVSDLINAYYDEWRRQSGYNWTASRDYHEKAIRAVLQVVKDKGCYREIKK